MATDTPPASTSVLSVRVSAQERALLEQASGQNRTTLSEFVRGKALEAAELEVLDRRIIVIPASDWKRFEAWVNRPGEAVPGLHKLARTTPSWLK